MENKVVERNMAKQSTIAEEFLARINEENRKSKIMDKAPLIILLVLAVLMSVFVQGFFTFTNLINIFNQLSTPLVLTVGLTFVILLGSIDLSIEGVIGYVGSVVTLLVLNSKTHLDLGVFAILISVVAGTLVGAVNGFIHVKLRLPSFIVSFGINGIMYGLAVLSYKGRPARVIDPLFEQISHGVLLGIPYLTWFAIFIFIVGYMIQEYTAFGRHVFAIGDNENVLRSTGINVDRIKILVFALSAFCASIAGIFGAMRLGLGEVAIGNGYLFYAITAVVVGGTSLSGGKGGVVHSLIGTLIVTIIQNSMILLGVNAYIQASIQGIIIILAVAISVQRGKKIIIK